MLAVGPAKHNPLINCTVSVSVGVIMIVAFSLVLSPIIAKVTAFPLIQAGRASFYFYADTKEMYLEGPHFSEFFHNTTLAHTLHDDIR